MSRIYHCARIVREHWLAIPCDRLAIVVYELPDGSKAGWCTDHRTDADQHAMVRGWKRVEPAQAVAA